MCHLAPPPLPASQVKERVLQNDWSFAVQAKKYTEWMEAQVGAGGEGPWLHQHAWAHVAAARRHAWEHNVLPYRPHPPPSPLRTLDLCLAGSLSTRQPLRPSRLLLIAAARCSYPPQRRRQAPPMWSATCTETTPSPSACRAWPTCRRAHPHLHAAVRPCTASPALHMAGPRS